VSTEITQQDINRLDPENMYRCIIEFPQQLQDGFQLEFIEGKQPIRIENINNIIVLGMGGSAIGGDILRSYLAETLDMPIIINRNYNLPKFVNEKSLVIAASYSGNTEETLSAFKQALERKCQIIALTTGGKLAKLVKEHKSDHLNKPIKGNKLGYFILPSGLQPRAALGYSFGPLLQLMQNLGLISNQEKIIQETCELLTENVKQCSIDKSAIDNPAKSTAAKLKNKIVLIYAGSEFYDTIAVRFKGQICENAKQLAFANLCPEFNHNEIVGFEYPTNLPENVVAVFLEGSADHQQVSRRFEVTREILKDRKIETIKLHTSGPNQLAEIFSLIQLGDFVSYYLALENKTDPTPVKAIDRLKSKLEKSI